jgi:light-harvesting complex 1 beta chain
LQPTHQGIRLAAAGGQYAVTSCVTANHAARRLRGQGRKAKSEVTSMADVDRRAGSLSGLTESEAKEFHRLFMTSFIVFILIAIVAHFLVWQWRPWLPGTSGYTSSIVDQARSWASYIPYVFTA